MSGKNCAAGLRRRSKEAGLKSCGWPLIARLGAQDRLRNFVGEVANRRSAEETGEGLK